MDSYFNTQLRSTASTAHLRRSGGPAAALRQGHASAGTPGYRLSSDELHSGLEVNTLNLMALPVELITELIRLRKTWDGGVAAFDPRSLN